MSGPPYSTVHDIIEFDSSYGIGKSTGVTRGTGIAYTPCFYIAKIV